MKVGSSSLLCFAAVMFSVSDVASRPLPRGEKLVATGRQSTIASFNVGNLVTLLAAKGILILKALVLSPSGDGDRFSKRNLGESELAINDWEWNFAKHYVLAPSSGPNTCLMRLACENPDQAAEYLGAGKILLTGWSMYNGRQAESIDRYEEIMEDVRTAVDIARENNRVEEDICARNYPCMTDEKR
ncbi:uncharacterized protein LOC100905303 [Galendromus occidentalis]|uniref:Uncharacterized protein LOC100905303 n=1 Tax=Galendromus occidentalis TaxID=34638 RepID=A0AAJ6QYG7_9ACAR|nr:uncharacterized protein LOC100905303 [Galendromus occidentalis]